MSQIRAFLKKLNIGKALSKRKFLILVPFTLCLVLLYAGIKFEGKKLSYELSVNRQKEKELLKENLVLRSELERLKSPERVRKAAKEPCYKSPIRQQGVTKKELPLRVEAIEKPECYSNKPRINPAVRR